MTREQMIEKLIRVRAVFECSCAVFADWSTRRPAKHAGYCTFDSTLRVELDEVLAALRAPTAPPADLVARTTLYELEAALAAGYRSQGVAGWTEAEPVVAYVERRIAELSERIAHQSPPAPPPPAMLACDVCGSLSNVVAAGAPCANKCAGHYGAPTAPPADLRSELARLGDCEAWESRSDVLQLGTHDDDGFWPAHQGDIRDVLKSLATPPALGTPLAAEAATELICRNPAQDMRDAGLLLSPKQEERCNDSDSGGAGGVTAAIFGSTHTGTAGSAPAGSGTTRSAPTAPPAAPVIPDGVIYIGSNKLADLSNALAALGTPLAAERTIQRRADGTELCGCEVYQTCEKCRQPTAAPPQGQQGPPLKNPYGHVWGKPYDDGYATCRCGAREDTRSRERCPAAPSQEKG